MTGDTEIKNFKKPEKDGRITVARIWPKYKGVYESRAGVIMSLDPERFRTICVYLSRDSNKENMFEKHGYRTYYLSGNRSLRYFRFPVLGRLIKVLKKEGVDIVHCHKHKGTVYGAIAAMLAGTPAVISHVHGLDRTRNGRWLVNHLLLQRVDKILTVGESVREDVLKSNPGVPSHKVYSIGNSIDYELYNKVSLTSREARERLSLPADAFVFGTIGRLTPAKGQNYLIEAFGKIKPKLPSAHLILAGEGRFKNSLQKQAVDAGVADSVHFLGRREDVEKILRAMDVFILPSVGEEGLPKALLEAMASGVPCIASDFSGIPEILAGGKCGRLVRPGDANLLAEAMKEFAWLTEQQRNNIITKANAWIENEYSFKRVSYRVQNIYKNVLSHNEK